MYLTGDVEIGDAEAHLGRPFLERSGDALPHALGSLRATPGHPRRDLEMAGQLRPTARALGEVMIDDATLVVVDRVERVGTQELLDVGHRQLEIAHRRTSTSDPSSKPRIFLSPVRIRLFTVPSGSPRIFATSRYVCPPR